MIKLLFFLLFVSTSAQASICFEYFLNTQIQEMKSRNRVSSIVLLRERIHEALRLSTSNRKAIVVDLDDTLFLTQRRVLHILKAYDLNRGSSLFKHIKIQDLNPADYRGSILAYLTRTIKNPDAVSLEFLRFGNHIRKMFQQDMNLVFDEPNTDLIRELHYWAARDIEILYVTGRHQNQQTLSELFIKLSLAPAHGFFFKPHYEIPTEKYKRTVIEQFLSEGIEVLAMIDDYVSNFKELDGVLPKERLFLIRYNHEAIWYTNSH